MNRIAKTMTFTLALALSAGTVAAQAPAGPADITRILNGAGYTEIRDVEFDDGVWEADVRAADGRWHDVAVDASNGELMDDHSGRPLITATELGARLASAGYRDVHDLDLDDAVWEADATSAAGQRVELRINAHTGRVISESFDD